MEGIDGLEGELRGHRSQRRDRLRDTRRLGDDERGHDPCPRRVCDGRTHLAPVDAARRADDGVRRQPEKSDLDGCAPRDAPQVHELGGLDSRNRRRPLAQVVGVDLRLLQRAPERWRKGGVLEVREERTNRIGADGCHGGRDRAPRSGDDCRRREQLGAIHLELVHPRGDRRSAELDEADVATRENQGRGIDLLMRDPELGETAERGPAAPDELVVDTAARERGERSRVTGEHEQRVSVDRFPGRHDLARGEAAPLDEERDERLALGCVEAARPDRGAVASVPRRPPEPLDELVVGGVAPVDLHEQRAAVRARAAKPNDAGALVGLLDQVLSMYAELGQARRHVAEAGAPCRRPEHEVHDRRGDEADEERGERAARSACHRDRGGEHSEDDEPATDGTQRPDEVRRHRSDHADGCSEPDVGEVGAAALPREERVQDVRPAVGGEPRAQDADSDGDDEGQNGLSCDPIAAGDQRRDEDRSGPDGDEVLEERPHRVEPSGDRFERTDERQLERRRRIDGDEVAEDEERRDEENDVRRTPRAGLGGRCREGSDAEPDDLRRRADAAVEGRGLRGLPAVLRAHAFSSEISAGSSLTRSTGSSSTRARASK